jgi:hypothetical protein
VCRRWRPGDLDVPDPATFRTGIAAGVAFLHWGWGGLGLRAPLVMVLASTRNSANGAATCQAAAAPSAPAPNSTPCHADQQAGGVDGLVPPRERFDGVDGIRCRHIGRLSKQGYGDQAPTLFSQLIC